MAPYRSFQQAIFLVFLVSLFCRSTVAESRLDPYAVLGVDRKSTQDEIKASYRKKCLQYHPDKNVNKSEAEQRKCVDIFKQIQTANHLIGDEDSRRKYDRERDSFASAWANAGGNRGSDRYSGGGYNPYRPSRPPRSSYSMYDDPGDPLSAFFQRMFRTSSTDVEDAFSQSPIFSAFSRTYKSIYVQSVSISLEDLYKGAAGVEVSVKDSFWRRYLAAYRGGAAAYSLIKASVHAIMFASLPLIGKYAALAAGVSSFHTGIPKLSKQKYIIDIRPGYKGGKTVLKFESDRYDEPEVVFHLKEQSHNFYKRINNNLHITVYLSPLEARKGCTVHIPPLDPTDNESISLRLKPGEVRGEKEVCLRGRGWPIRKNATAKQQFGDLIVTIQVRLLGGWYRKGVKVMM